MTTADVVDEVAQAIVLDAGAEISPCQAVAFARIAVRKIQELRLRVVLGADDC